MPLPMIKRDTAYDPNGSHPMSHAEDNHKDMGERDQIPYVYWKFNEDPVI